ncbi:hypothetical protein GGD38_005841 [Chitinophagaceae bacterium OAS944]|nr:hypothetical protein [Chitinophagaceae bacterium OAS944]
MFIVYGFRRKRLKAVSQKLKANTKTVKAIVESEKPKATAEIDLYLLSALGCIIEPRSSDLVIYPPYSSTKSYKHL